jgi:hypothetical protein
MGRRSLVCKLFGTVLVNNWFRSAPGCPLKALKPPSLKPPLTNKTTHPLSASTSLGRCEEDKGKRTSNEIVSSVFNLVIWVLYPVSLGRRRCVWVAAAPIHDEDPSPSVGVCSSPDSFRLIRGGPAKTGPRKDINMKEPLPEAEFDVLPAAPGRRVTFYD